MLFKQDNEQTYIIPISSNQSQLQLFLILYLYATFLQAMHNIFLGICIMFHSAYTLPGQSETITQNGAVTQRKQCTFDATVTLQ